MRHPPTTTYCGLTIIMDKPSRFDDQHLLTGLAGQWLEEDVIKPYPLSACDVMTNPSPAPLTFLPGTRFVAWLGLGQTTPCGDNPCGYITNTGTVRHVQAWSPQDCLDVKNYESSADEDKEDDFTDLDSKASYPTKRANFRHWTTRIIQKLINPTTTHYAPIKIIAYPRSLAEATAILNNTANEDIFLDIETSPLKRAIQCIGFSTTAIFPRVFTIPVYLFNGRRAYNDKDFFRFHRAFSISMSCESRDNTIVVHNHGFDLLILHAWYKFHMARKVYDTMHAGHRCFPEAEKSLSHNLVNWTELPYHKITSVETFNEVQQRNMWDYNARDVYALKYIKDAQQAHASTIPGLTDSITQVNACAPAYLDMTFTGLPVDRVAQLNTEQDLFATKRQLERIIRLLVGQPTFNPGSTKQISSYLHDRLKYPVVGRTETGAPKLGRKQMFQLLLKHSNPALQAIIAYKRVAKDLSMLAFELWSTPLAPTPATSTQPASLPTRTPGRLVYQRPT